MRIDHVLLHLLTLCQFLLTLDLELGVFGDSLDDGHGDASVFLDVVLTEVFESVFNVLYIRVVFCSGRVDITYKAALRTMSIVMIGRVVTVLTIKCKDVIQLLLLPCFLNGLAFDQHLAQAFRDSLLDLILQLHL